MRTTEDGKIVTVQDDIMNALKKLKPISPHAIAMMKEREQKSQEDWANRYDVHVEDYKAWCSGVDVPHVRDAVLKAEGRKE